jgi:ABC-type molybdenum transport system ATPase subunit/photorepair protein PhrA
MHPGLVILDEPLQQNPDPQHRSLFLKFLAKDLAKTLAFQTLVFTSLTGQEISSLRKQGVTVITPEGKHFLTPIPRGEVPRQPSAAPIPV